jgi:hypothetical protein
MKNYVNDKGVYLGGWDANPPHGAIEVPSAPDDARQPWIGGKWGEAPVSKPVSPVDKLKEFLSKNPDVRALIDGLNE